MRAFAEKRDGGTGNRAAQERFADLAESRARATPAPGGLLAGGTLSDEGRRYFGAVVGGDVGNARVHVGGRADAIAGLAHAQAVSVGNEVFLPKGAESDRGLLAHELAHVAHAPAGTPPLARKPKEVEPHYPTPAEQKTIAKLLGRDFKGVTPTPAATAGAEEPVATSGRILNEAERTALAAKLEPILFAAIDAMFEPDPSPAPAMVSEADAFVEIERARADVIARYGTYATHGITITRDATTTAEERVAANQLLVHYGPVPNPERPFVRTILNGPEYCPDCFVELAVLEDESKEAVISLLIEAAVTRHWDMLTIVAKKRVGGKHGGKEAKVFIKSKPTREEVYGTAVHEFLHNLAHPAFSAAFLDERNIVEGFTEYFTRGILPNRTNYLTEYAKVHGVREAMTSPFWQDVVGGAAEESMRQAYFKGRLDLIGWRPSQESEKTAVKNAGGSEPWDPARGELTVQKQLAIQSPKLNYVGTGIYFSRLGDPTIHVDYARVLVGSKFSTNQLLLEGQLLGTPGENPRLGGSVGLFVEKQDPWFYITGGLRVSGTADLVKDDHRVDVGPVAGAGVRLWQRVRVGPEAMVLFPIHGSGVDVGLGGVIRVELGKK